MSEYNLRQLNLMLDRIEWYENKSIDLCALIQDLLGLLNALEDFDDLWKEEFRSNWINLDVIYAIAIDRNVNPEDLDKDGEIVKTLDALTKLITLKKDAIYRDSIKNKILEKAISLEEICLYELAWTKNDAINLINSLISDELGILGGDVYLDHCRAVSPLSDNWSAIQKTRESKNDFFQRSKLESLEYIERFPIASEGRFIFSLVFTDEIDLQRD